MEVVGNMIPWVVVGVFWVFVVWAIWTFVGTARGMLEQLRRIADYLEGTQAGP